MVTHRRTFVVTVEHDDLDEDGFDELFGQYLTEQEHPFLHDYSQPSWGGYKGPFVRSVSVSMNGIERWNWREGGTMSKYEIGEVTVPSVRRSLDDEGWRPLRRSPPARRKCQEDHSLEPLSHAITLGALVVVFVDASAVALLALMDGDALGARRRKG